ncbi:transcriptional repressor TCF25-domain-containing protein [Zygosaccharomyces rouxii]|nr:transcriptional repressor TCF25-domain-containing protein [Zygosaccharomyces rouxii]
MSSRALRKLQNDQELLDSLLGSPKTSDEKPKKSDIESKTQNANIFALMNDGDDEEGSDREVDQNQESPKNQEEEKPKVQLPTRSQKKAKKKNKKSSKGSKKSEEPLEESNNDDDDDNDDGELEAMIQQYKKHDALKYGVQDFDHKEDEEYDITLESFAHACKFYDLKNDSGFTQFPASCLQCCTGFFNNDFRKLDPHFEFKLLFDDISAESLEDIESMSSTHISPQQLKQVQRLKRLVRNWGGKDHRSVPTGPGSAAHRLQFTKIQEDWLPTPRGELSMQSLGTDDLCEWQLWQRPTDWKDVVEEDVNNWRKKVSFYKFEPLNPDISKKAMTEFYLSVILHPDHESLIHLISSKFPYHVPALLQVALITIRQGDRSNTSGLIQRALFVFDRALRAGIKFDSLSCQLPYTYFFNRQFFLAIFRYILLLAQRGAVATAGEWCKALWSLSPLEDPLGCRYFIDHYLLLNKEYHYLIELSKSPLMTCYRQWYTLGLALGTVLSYLRLENPQSAREELVRAFKYHAHSLASLFVEKLRGDPSLTQGLEFQADSTQVLETKAYGTRFGISWQKPENLNFLNTELTNLFKKFQTQDLEIAPAVSQEEVTVNPFFVEGIPVNLLRFSVLSEESPVMASIPTSVWSNHEVYEFDILPPTPTTKESRDFVEDVRTFINDQELARSQMDVDQDEALLSQIRQLSLEQFLEENPNVAPE